MTEAVIFVAALLILTIAILAVLYGWARGRNRSSNPIVGTARGISNKNSMTTQS